MKTNSKHVKNEIRAHILERVENRCGEPFATFEHARAHLLAEFERVASHPHNMKRHPNRRDRFEDYLMGLPFAFEYTHHGIAEYLNGLGINPDNKPFSPDKSQRLYATLILRETGPK